MINSVTASRRLAVRMLAWQAACALIVAALFLAEGVRSAGAAALGGAVVVLGNGLMALRVFGGRQRVGAGMALADMIVGLVLKWIVFIVGLYVLLAAWRLPALAVLAGMGTAMVVNLFALRFKEQA